MTSDPFQQARAGALAILPAVVAAAPFALLLGQQAALKGLSPLEVMAMSALVFAGSAQFLAVTLWETPVPVLLVALSTLLINLRHVLMSASLAEKIEGFGRWRWPAVFLMTDEGWAVAERRALAESLTLTFWFAAGLFLWLNWLALTTLGAIAGAFVREPERYGLDFAFPAIFIGLALGFWQGWRTAPVIGASAAAAILVERLVPGAWYVIAGALAGIAAAMLQASRGAEARA